MDYNSPDDAVYVARDGNNGKPTRKQVIHLALPADYSLRYQGKDGKTYVIAISDMADPGKTMSALAQRQFKALLDGVEGLSKTQKADIVRRGRETPEVYVTRRRGEITDRRARGDVESRKGKPRIDTVERTRRMVVEDMLRAYLKDRGQAMIPEGKKRTKVEALFYEVNRPVVDLETDRRIATAAAVRTLPSLDKLLKAG